MPMTTPAPAPRRLLLAVLCLAGAALACARADLPIEPAEVVVLPPLVITPFASPTALASPTAPPAPGSTAGAATQTPPPLPTDAPTQAATQPPAATQAPTGAPTQAASPTPSQPTPEPPAPGSTAPAPGPTAGGGAASPTPPQTPAEIPADAEFTQQFTVTAEGDTPVGLPRDLADGRDITWASLRNGQGAWIFNLSNPGTIVGVRLLAHRDGDQDTTLRGIDVSQDGEIWVEVYAASGVCGDVTGCDVLAQRVLVDLPFGPAEAQYVRLRAGPTRFAIAELEVAVLP